MISYTYLRLKFSLPEKPKIDFALLFHENKLCYNETVRIITRNCAYLLLLICEKVTET